MGGRVVECSRGLREADARDAVGVDKDVVEERLVQLSPDMRRLGTVVPESTASDLLALVNDVKWANRGLVIQQMKAYTEIDIGAVLVDLYRVGYDEFDPEDPANTLDYNADDDFPEGCETPHNYLSDLVQEAVTARLIKGCGRELMLAWVDAQSDGK